MTAILLLLLACFPGMDDDAVATPVDENAEKVARAVELAKAIQADPENAEAVLEEKGVTEDELNELLYEIAAEPTLSETYASALEE